jgi:hypothetical protein
MATSSRLSQLQPVGYGSRGMAPQRSALFLLAYAAPIQIFLKIGFSTPIERNDTYSSRRKPIMIVVRMAPRK